jgi:hypothetical protein
MQETKPAFMFSMHNFCNNFMFYQTFWNLLTTKLIFVFRFILRRIYWRCWIYLYFNFFISFLGIMYYKNPTPLIFPDTYPRLSSVSSYLNELSLLPDHHPRNKHDRHKERINMYVLLTFPRVLMICFSIYFKENILKMLNISLF